MQTGDTWAKARFGRLQWTRYTAASGSAAGVLWGNNCDPDCATGTFTATVATVRVSRPRNGVFTLATVTTGRHSFTITASENGGYWGWE